MEHIDNLKRPSCEELWPLLVLGMGNDWNGNIVDDASLEVMKRIEKTMQRLAVMGEDDCRYLWIQPVCPQPSDGEEDGGWEEEPDAKGLLWYELLTAHCGDFHYLLLTNRSWRFVDLRSAHHIHAQRDPNEVYCDLKEPLLRLERYANELVDAILIDPDAYNDYVEQNLPFRKRDGIVKRSDLYAICPIYRRIENPGFYLKAVEEMLALGPKRFKRMTLRLYRHYWRMAYVAYRTLDDYRPEPSGSFDGLSDEEVFEHSSKGLETRTFDLDLEQDYLRWEEENSLYHCHDVAYARIHLVPRRDDDGLWRLELSYNVVGYFRDALNIVTAFLKQGVGLDIGDFADEAVRKLREEDYITLTPLPNKYREEMSLPCPDEDITPAMVAEIIRLTRWKSQARVKPR